MSNTTKRDYLLAEIRRITREKGSCWKRDAQQLIRQLEAERDPFARLDFAGTGTEATGRKHTAPRGVMDSGSVEAWSNSQHQLHLNRCRAPARV